MKSNLTEKESKEAEDVKERGNLAFNEGDWENAISHYTKALELRPDWGIVYSNRSHAYGKASRHVEALADAIRCVELERKWWKSFLRLGEAYMRLDRYREACEAFWQSSICRSISGPNERFPELERRLEEAKQKSMDSGQGCPSLPSLEVVQMARTAEGYTEMSHGNNAFRSHSWQQVHRLLSPEEQACEHYGRALDYIAAEEGAACYKYQSYAYERMGEYQAALEEADKALVADPQCWLGSWLRANALFGQQRPHEAYEEIVKAEDAASDYGTDVKTLLTVSGKSLKQFVGDAKAKIQNELMDVLVLWQLMRYRAKDHETAKQRGNEAFKKGDFHDAIGHYTTALTLKPSWAVVYANRCTSRLKLQQLSLALEDAEKCVACDTEWWKGHLRLGEVLNELGQHRKALSCLQEARSKVGSGEGNLNNLRYILHQIGRTEGMLLAAETLAKEAAAREAERGREYRASVERQTEQQVEADASKAAKADVDARTSAAPAKAVAKRTAETRVVEQDSESEDDLDLDDQELSEGARARAEAALSRRQYDVAIDQLSYAMSLVQDSAELYALRCEAYMAKAEETSDPNALLKRAEEDAKRLLELDVCADAFFVAGELCERMGRPEQARMMYARAVEEDPMLSVAVVRLYMLTKTLPVGVKGLSKRVRTVLECAERDGIIDSRGMGIYPAVDKGVDAGRHSYSDREKRAGSVEAARPAEQPPPKAAPRSEGSKGARKGEAAEAQAQAAGMAEAQEWCDAYLSDRGKMSEFLAFVSRIASEGPGGGAGVNSAKLTEFARAAQKEMVAWSKKECKGGDLTADLSTDGERRKQVELLFQKVNGFQLSEDCTLAEALERGMKDGVGAVFGLGGKGASVEVFGDGDEGGETKKKKKKAKKKKKKATGGEGGADGEHGEKAGDECGEAEEGDDGMPPKEDIAVPFPANSELPHKQEAEEEKKETSVAAESAPAPSDARGKGSQHGSPESKSPEGTNKRSEEKDRGGSRQPVREKVLPAPGGLQVADLDHGIHRVENGKTVIGTGGDEVINVSFHVDTDQAWSIHSVQAQVNGTPLKLQRLPTGPKMYCALPRNAIVGDCKVQLRIRKKGGEWSEWSQELPLLGRAESKSQAAKPAAKKPESAAEEAKTTKPAAQRADEAFDPDQRKDTTEGGVPGRKASEGPSGRDVTATKETVGKEPTDGAKSAKNTSAGTKGNAKGQQREQGGPKKIVTQGQPAGGSGAPEGSLQYMLDEIARSGVMIEAMVLKDLHSLGEALAKTALSSLMADLSGVENPSAFLSAVIQSLLDHKREEEQRSHAGNGVKPADSGGHGKGGVRHAGVASTDGGTPAPLVREQGGPACVAVDVASAEAVSELVNAMQALGLMGQFDLLEMTSGQSQVPSRWTLVASYRGEDGSGQRVSELLRSLQQFCAGKGGAVPRLVRVGQRQCTEMLKASGWSVVKQGLFSPQQAAAAGVHEAGERIASLEMKLKGWMEHLRLHQERCLSLWNQPCTCGVALQQQPLQQAMHEVEDIFGVLQQFLAVLPDQTNAQIHRLKALREGVLIVLQHTATAMRTRTQEAPVRQQPAMQHQQFPSIAAVQPKTPQDSYPLYMPGGAPVWTQAQGAQWNAGLQGMNHLQGMESGPLPFASQNLPADGDAGGLPALLDPVWGSQTGQHGLGDFCGAPGLVGARSQQSSMLPAGHISGMSDNSALQNMSWSASALADNEMGQQQTGLGMPRTDFVQVDGPEWSTGMGGLPGPGALDSAQVVDGWNGIDDTPGWAMMDSWSGWQGGADSHGISAPSWSTWSEGASAENTTPLWTAGVADANDADASLWAGVRPWTDPGTTWSDGTKGMGWSSFPVDSA